jgi:hypothetical protein
LDAADITSVISKRGAWYYYDMDGMEVALGQGREKAVAFLESEDNAKVREALEAATREKMQSGELAAGPIADVDSLDSDDE